MKRASAAGGLFVFLFLIPLGLTATSGAPRIPRLHWDQIQAGLEASYLNLDVVITALVYACWILWTYLVIVVALRAVATILVRRNSIVGQPLMNFTGAVTPRFVRRLVDLTVGAALVASTTINLAHAGTATMNPVSHVAHAVTPESPSADVQTNHLHRYMVRPGDTLWDIAEDELGSGYRWREIYELNRGRAFTDGRVLTNPRLIRPGWELELPNSIREVNAPPATSSPTEELIISLTPTPTEIRKSTREIEHERVVVTHQHPVVDLPSGAALAASFASGLLAAQALSSIRRRSARRALAGTDEPDPRSLILDLQRRVASPVAGHLEAAAFEIAGSWQRTHSSLPRITAAIEEPDRAIFFIAKPPAENGAILPPSSSRVLYQDAGDMVRAEVRRPFPPKMVRAETPLETGLLTPIGAVGKEGAVHVGLLGIGGLAISGEQAEAFTNQALLSCAADISADDLEIYLLGEASNLEPSIGLNHVRASADWDKAPEVLNGIQAELLARARAFMNEGVEDFWSFLAARVDERMGALVLVASKPPAPLLGVVEAIASQMQTLGGAFIALEWTPLPIRYAVEVGSRVHVEPPLPKLPPTLLPLLLTPQEMAQAVETINEARPPGWGSAAAQDESPLDTEDPMSHSAASGPAHIALPDDPQEEPPASDSEVPESADIALPAEPKEERLAPKQSRVVVLDDDSPALFDQIGEVPQDGQLEVRAFGNLAVIKDGRVIEKGLRSASKELLAFLISQPTGVNKDRIIDALYPEQDFESACAELSRNLYFLKRRTGYGQNDHVERVNETYRLDFKFWWTDVGAFESIITEAGALAAEDAIKRLTVALDLYRGPFCDDCYYSWLGPLRDRYRNLFIKSSARLANLLVEYGEADDAIGVLDRGIEIDPVNEDLYRRAMALEGRIGRTKAVLKRYNKLEAILQDELDVDPDEETAGLVRQIMRESEEKKRALKG